MISTNQESNAAPGSDAEKAEIAPALNLLGKVDEMFFEVRVATSEAGAGRGAARRGSAGGGQCPPRLSPFICARTRACFALFLCRSPRCLVLDSCVCPSLPSIRPSLVQVVNNYAPADDGKDSNVFVTTSYDATSHFESATDEVIDLYRRVTGKELDLTIPAEVETEQ